MGYVTAYSTLGAVRQAKKIGWKKYFSRVFKVKKDNVTIVKGKRGKQKIVRILKKSHLP